MVGREPRAEPLGAVQERERWLWPGRRMAARRTRPLALMKLTSSSRRPGAATPAVIGQSGGDRRDRRGDPAQAEGVGPGPLRLVEHAEQAGHGEAGEDGVVDDRARRGVTAVELGVETAGIGADQTVAARPVLLAGEPDAPDVREPAGARVRAPAPPALRPGRCRESARTARAGPAWPPAPPARRGSARAPARGRRPRARSARARASRRARRDRLRPRPRRSDRRGRRGSAGSAARTRRRPSRSGGLDQGEREVVGGVDVPAGQRGGPPRPGAIRRRGG